MKKFFKLMTKLALKFLAGFAVFILMCIIAIFAMNLWDHFDLSSYPVISNIAGILAAIFMVVLAVVLLCWQDRTRHKAALKKLRKVMANRSAISDEDYLAVFCQQDRQLASQIRKVLADFFKIPVEKINPADNLKTDYKIPNYEPWIYMAVYSAICPEIFDKIEEQNLQQNQNQTNAGKQLNKVTVVQYNQKPSQTIQDLIDETKNFIARYDSK